MTEIEKHYNGETDFEKWYLAHYGKAYDPNVGFTRAEGMDDGTWNVGSVLYGAYNDAISRNKAKNEELSAIGSSYDTSVKTVNENYNTAMGKLDTNKTADEQTAAVSHRLLEKYLTDRARSEGKSGLDLGATTALKAYNVYSNRMGEIGRGYSDKAADLETERGNSIAALEREKEDKTNSVISRYNDLDRTAESNTRGTAKNAWDNYVKETEAERTAFVNGVRATADSIVESGDYETARKYLEANRENLGEDYYNEFMGIVDLREEGDKKAEEEKKKAEEESKIFDKAAVDSGLDIHWTGNSFTATAGSGENAVTHSNLLFGKEVTKVGDTAQAVIDTLGEHELFKYNGYVYIKHNGKVYTVANYGSEADWREFKNALRDLAPKK